MYLCYIDESGTPDVPGNTSHYVLAGLSIPIWHWKSTDRAINGIKGRHHLRDTEIHTGWLLRPYLEQSKIAGFETMGFDARRRAVEQYRNKEMLRLQRANNTRLYRQTKKNFAKTAAYIHLTLSERRAFVEDVARSVGSWGSARLFAECIDKIHFDPHRRRRTVDEQAFEQVVSRFEQYLANMSESNDRKFGLLIHDNNQTVASKHTDLMKRFHRMGTLWTKVDYIIETPLFVDSELTSLVQIADLCSYALRRYLENNETFMFEHVFQRADRRGDVAVGVRHFTDDGCSCRICSAHRQNSGQKPEPVQPELI